MKKYTQREKYLLNVKKNKIKILLSQIGILIAFIGIWEFTTAVGWVDAFFISSPSRIVRTFISTLHENLLHHIFITLNECILGFIISTLLGIIIAVLLWWSTFLRKVLDPYIVILNSLPKIALGPIIIIWMGTDIKAIVTMTILICIIVTIISVLNGFLACDEGKILLLKSMGATKWQILTKLIMPYSLPNFVSVLKINVGLSWVGTIMGEYLVSNAGLGYLIIYGGQVFQLDLVMMSTVILCILAGGMYFIVAALEKWLKKRQR